MIRAMQRICMLLFASIATIESQYVAATEMDSGVDYYNGPQKIRWLNNNEVVAMLVEQKKMIMPDGFKRSGSSLYHWNLSANKVRKIAGPMVEKFCLTDGNIGYSVLSPADWGKAHPKEYAGLFGSEKLQTLEKGAASGYRNICPEIISQQMPDWMSEAKKLGRVFVPLMKEHGWLEIGVRSDKPKGQNNFLAAIFPPGSTRDEGKTIDPQFGELLHDSGFHFTHVGPDSYVPARNAYAIQLTKNSESMYGSDGKIRKDRLFPYIHKPEDSYYIWLYPDGRIEKMRFHNPVASLNGGKRFTGKFLVLVRGNILDPDDPNQGIFLDHPSGILRVAAGNAENVSASPDGCKIAFGIGTISKEEGWRYRLKAVDLCKVDAK